MHKKLKITLIFVLGLAILVYAATFLADNILKNKLENTVKEQLPKNMQLDSASFSVNTRKMAVEATNIHLKIRHKNASENASEIHVKSVRAEGIGLWHYLFSDAIDIEHVTIASPKINWWKTEQDTTDTKDSKKPKPKIKIHRFSMTDGALVVKKAADSSKTLALENIHFQLDGLQVNEETLAQKIPFATEAITATANQVFYAMGTYDVLSMERFSFKENVLDLQELRLQTQPDKKELSKLLTKERDHFDLHIPEISLEEITYGYRDTTFYVSGKTFVLKDPEFKVYRDKLVADDKSTKPLYSQSLRELPFVLKIDSTFIQNGAITYEERVNTSDPPGSIHFENLEATIAALGNHYEKGEAKTKIHVRSNFMKSSLLTVDWDFDVQNTTDAFQFQGKLANLKANRMNSFAQPNLGIRMEGILDTTYFNIHGNREASESTMRLKYDSFKVQVLNKRKEKNKLLSAVTNIFVKRDSNDKKGDFKEASTTVERKKDRSVFNFIWISLEKGLQEMMLSI